MAGDLKLKRKSRRKRSLLSLLLFFFVVSSALGIFVNRINKTNKNDNIPIASDDKKEDDLKDKNDRVEEKNEEKEDTDTSKQTSSNVSSNLNTKERDWFFIPKKDGSPSGIPDDVAEIISKHSAYYLGNTSEKIIYLTFDEGYENGYTSKILDILKENDVKAAFFVVKPYINSNKDLIKRMVEEGHLVCNHSNTHPSMASAALKGKEAFEKEFTDTEKAFEEVTGQKMPKFFRPPMGKYSELSLQYTKDLGYKTIFWSFAYNDWDIKKQPSHETAKKVLLDRAHSGGIYLLHAVSKTNTEILDWFIKDAKSKGYRFASLNELP
ncbi:delta-lactam-biosynthetic de-N-acetylase [uncultured Clostridium sp.]|uniref:delta-lactam-biosynthetic de-N-acetylase n=1 Tax=uncultured Clostridium sp. TaxID=59620 RepID=UPI0028EEAC16|nr:delta-lactam-biosynthetic de-N-acetylase [uncultured Clostridium sp.]